MNQNVISLCLLFATFADISSNHATFLNKWAVEILGGDSEAEQIAQLHGFKNLGKVSSLGNIYVFEHHEVHKRSLGPSRHHHSSLLRDPKVEWVEQQVAKKRVKRDDDNNNVIPSPSNSKTHKWKGLYNDHLWSKMWYMHGGADGGYDMNVLGAWERGYTGEGVVVTILDDGIEHTHPDLKTNYDPEASSDINGPDDDPMPRYDNRDENRHGTRCAGEVAAIANNSKCVVGLAYNAKIGGVRMLDGDVTDLVEASALGHNPQHVDVYSASWGPDDNGKVVDGPAKLAKDTFVRGVLHGRGGKGSIFVWASGNGGSLMDSCSCDGYTNSIFTLSVSSVSEHNTKPWYLEECASTLATTYSSGENYHDRKILTTDLHGRCTEQHTGTSASAPLAAALVALALEANGDLTWRDMQYLVIETSNTKPFQDAEWVINGVGRKVSHRYGYGLMDAEALVKTAERWTTVPPQHVCQSDHIILDQPLDAEGVELEIDANGCEGSESHIKYLEHVQAKVTLRYSRRGDLEIYLISPQGTRSKLLPHRKNDHLEGTFSEWPFMSVFFWGENPEGTWRLQIVNVGTKYNHGIIEKWQLVLYGTAEQPVHLKPEMKFPYKGSGNGDEENAVNKDGEMSYSGDDYNETNQGNLSGVDLISLQPVLEWSCDSECDEEAGCTGPHLHDCRACKHYRLLPDGHCVSSCPPHTYLVASMATCVSCEAPCDRCSGPDILTDCQRCTQGYYLVPELGQCLAQCREGTYQAADENICLPCAVGCTVCSGSATHCSLCQPGYTLELNHQCVMHCQHREFKNQHNTCELCHKSCWSCFGAGDRHCSQCMDGLMYQNGSCIPHCATGYFPLHTTEGGLCQQCHESCYECVGPDLDECTVCYEPMKLAGGVCLQSCPLGGYDAAYGICGSCHMTCNTCHGPEDYHCLSCDFGYWLQDGQCLSFCNVGFYPFEVYTDMGERVAECSPCHPTCESCDGGGAYSCITCHLGLVLSQDGDCLTECPLGFVNDEMGSCLPCSEPCSTCSRPSSSTDCTSCDHGLVLFHGECIDYCPEEFYEEEGVCYICHPSCQLCTSGGPSGCTVCSSGFVQQGVLCTDQTQTYTITCDIDHYFNQDKGSCLPCHSTCSSCEGPEPSDCLSCAPPTMYYPQFQICIPCCSTREISGSYCCICMPGESICRDENVMRDNNKISTLSSSSTPPHPTTINSKSSTKHHSDHTSSSLTPKQPSDLKPPFSKTNSREHSTSPSHKVVILTTSSDKPHTSNSKIKNLQTTKPIGKTIGSYTTTTTNYITSTTQETNSFNTNHALSLIKKHWITLVTFLVFACVFSVGVFFLIFGLLQARSNDQLCWGRHRYQPVPTSYKNGTTTIDSSTVNSTNKVCVRDHTVIEYLDEDEEEAGTQQENHHECFHQNGDLCQKA